MAKKKKAKVYEMLAAHNASRSHTFLMLFNVLHIFHTEAGTLCHYSYKCRNVKEIHLNRRR